MKIIDIHCHVLPNMDDGSSSIQESQQMLRMAYEQGICSVIATPHYSAQFKSAASEQVIQGCKELEGWARKELDSKFCVYPGQEIFASHHIIDKIDQKELVTLAGSRYILLEFLPSVSFSSIYETVRWLAMSPYHPILAHVERYQVLRKGKMIEELLDAGVLMQMNYSSVSGKWYEDTTRWCRKMLLEGNIHFLATDMHNVKDRCPHTAEAIKWMEKHLDEGYIQELCSGNACEFLLDKSI